MFHLRSAPEGPRDSSLHVKAGGVAIVDNDLPPLFRRLRRISATLPGRDGVIGAYKIRQPGGTQLTWPAQTLCLLETADTDAPGWNDVAVEKRKVRKGSGLGACDFEINHEHRIKRCGRVVLSSYTDTTGRAGSTVYVPCLAHILNLVLQDTSEKMVMFEVSWS